MFSPTTFNSAKVDYALATYILGSAGLFAFSYILDLDSGPMYFGLAGLILAALCVMGQGLRLPAKGTMLLGVMAFVAIVNTSFAMSREQTGARWLMIIGLYACSLRLTEIPATSIRRTLELTLPIGLLVQIFALRWHLENNLEGEKAVLIWHTISLFAGLLIAIGLGYTNKLAGSLIIVVGLCLVALSGARGALIGLIGMALIWVACQPPGRRLGYALLVSLTGFIALLFGGELLSTFSGIKVVRVNDDPIEHMIKSFEGRLDLIRTGFDFSKDSALSGTGLGAAYQQNFRIITGLSHPHNSYVSMLIEMGFLFGILYSIGSILAIIRTIKVNSATNLSLLLAPALAYFLVRGMAENYSLLGLGNFASSIMILIVAISINHRAR